MKKIVTKILLLGIIITGTLTPAVSLNAEEISGFDYSYATKEQKKAIQSNLVKGIFPESITNMDNPINEIEENLIDGTKTTYIYSDGSSMSRSISGGSCQNGSGYKVCYNRVVKQNGGIYTAVFYADYQTVQGMNDSITAMRSAHVTGKATMQSAGIQRKTESGSRKAYAELIYNYYGKTVGLRLYVGKDKVSSSLQYYN